MSLIMYPRKEIRIYIFSTTVYLQLGSACIAYQIDILMTTSPFVMAVRTALVALIAFMPTNPNGALGSLDYKKEERRVLAVKSREAAPKFGNPERQQLIDEIHAYMLSKAPPVPQISSGEAVEENFKNGEGEVQVSAQDAGTQVADGGTSSPTSVDRIVEDRHEAPLNANPIPEGMAVARQVIDGPLREQQALLQRPDTRLQKPADDRLFTLAAVGLTIALALLLLKKFLKASEYGAVFMDGS